ncbi:MAG TPA: tetratricopeptide repeat protein [Sphingobacteriaceae bacterium]|nr:tetratricopeptide repeat protein [Sphingobacteriaceae bacterium]
MRPCIFLILLFVLPGYTYSQSPRDTSHVIELNRIGFENRLTDPDQTLANANKALVLARKLNYINGIAEAYRVKGVGYYYKDNSKSSIESYLTSMNFFRRNKNIEGEAKVLNNLGNLYREVDNDKALGYFNKSLQLALKLDDTALIGGLYLNTGTIYYVKGKYYAALKSYEKSYKIFTDLDNSTGLTQCLQNLSMIYRKLNQLDKAEQYSLEARQKAKEKDLNVVVVASNLGLAGIYTDMNKFQKAEAAIQEGLAYSKLLNDERFKYDHLIVSYKLEFKRKNYEKALSYLQQVYTTDSITYYTNNSDRIKLSEVQFRQREREVQNKLTIEKNKNAQLLLIGSTVVVGLACIVIFLLIIHVKRKTKNNKQLQQLNQEVSEQKENLNRVNQSLEEIIEDRTQDLRKKNRKLSEYSSHLSHEIRSPIATLKGLMLLEKDKLLSTEEIMKEVNVCVNDIDDKIVNINENLNDLNIPGFKSEDV